MPLPARYEASLFGISEDPAQFGEQAAVKWLCGLGFHSKVTKITLSQ